MKSFYSDIPLWFLFLWIILTIAISIYFYQKKGWVKDLSKFQRYSLIFLRGIGLFLIGLLLFGILLKGRTSEVAHPYIITIIDDSESMLNYSDSNEVKDLSKSLLQSLQTDDESKYTHLIFTLNDLLKNTDSLAFKSKNTDLSSMLEKIYENYYGRNIGAIVLVSDGNFNQGISPVISTEKFRNTPIYTLSVGDTIQKVDHLIKSILVNEIAFLGNSFPVEVTIEGNKTPQKSFDIQLFQNGKLLETKHLVHQNDEYSMLKTMFYLDAKSIGIHEYTVKISNLPNEYNTRNNTQSFYVEVLDDQSKILIVSEGLNPDAGAIRRALDSEKNLSVTACTLDDFPKSLKEFDLIIWYGPGIGKDITKFEELNNLNKPKWYIIPPQVSSNDLTKLHIQATIQTSNRSDNVRAAFNQQFNLFELSNEERKFLDKTPPLKTNFGSIKYGLNSSILAYQKLGTIVKPDPLFFFGKNQNTKFALTYGVGLWNWGMLDYSENQSQDNFNSIIRKTIQYLIVKENTSRLRIQIPSISNTNIDFVVGASFYNDSYEPITDPKIKFELKNEQGESLSYEFIPLEKTYTLNLGKLPVGRYSWKASTEFNNIPFSKEGNFAISDISIEKQDTKANHQLLKQIAENGGGEFSMLKNYSETYSNIETRKDIVPIAFESSTYSKLVDYIWLLLLIVSVFTIEWVLRRYFGSY
ncbi:MAG: VWA domain-containing protein [Brumimicrobium sp.]|nr:VWA domain-containing protein [Brumimicrobium sp.]